MQVAVSVRTLRVRILPSDIDPRNDSYGAGQYSIASYSCLFNLFVKCIRTVSNQLAGTNEFREIKICLLIVYKTTKSKAYSIVANRRKGVSQNR